jgi:hypothetical protein
MAAEYGVGDGQLHLPLGSLISRREAASAQRHLSKASGASPPLNTQSSSGAASMGSTSNRRI